jgi:hypothetical protein
MGQSGSRIIVSVRFISEYLNRFRLNLVLMCTQSLSCEFNYGLYRQIYHNFYESLKGRDHSEDLGVDGRIILK